jgi:hypothetical protein
MYLWVYVHRTRAPPGPGFAVDTIRYRILGEGKTPELIN